MQSAVCTFVHWLCGECVLQRAVSCMFCAKRDSHLNMRFPFQHVFKCESANALGCDRYALQCIASRSVRVSERISSTCNVHCPCALELSLGVSVQGVHRVASYISA